MCALPSMKYWKPFRYEIIHFTCGLLQPQCCSLVVRPERLMEQTHAMLRILFSYLHGLVFYLSTYLLYCIHVKGVEITLNQWIEFSNTIASFIHWVTSSLVLNKMSQGIFNLWFPWQAFCRTVNLKQLMIYSSPGCIHAANFDTLDIVQLLSISWQSQYLYICSHLRLFSGHTINPLSQCINTFQLPQSWKRL